MPYVQRDGDGAIKGAYAQPQPGYATEFLADDNADLVAFLAASSSQAIYRDNRIATRAPNQDDDITQGFGPSSRWRWGAISYECESADAGEAVWRRIRFVDVPETANVTDYPLADFDLDMDFIGKRYTLNGSSATFADCITHTHSGTISHIDPAGKAYVFGTDVAPLTDFGLLCQEDDGTSGDVVHSFTSAVRSLFTDAGGLALVIEIDWRGTGAGIDPQAEEIFAAFNNSTASASGYELQLVSVNGRFLDVDAFDTTHTLGVGPVERFALGHTRSRHRYAAAWIAGTPVTARVGMDGALTHEQTGTLTIQSTCGYAQIGSALPSPLTANAIRWGYIRRFAAQMAPASDIDMAALSVWF